MKSSDLYLSAFLLTSGVRLLGTEKVGSRVFFLFEAHPEITQLKRVYYNNTGRVPAREFVDNVRLLKDRVFKEISHG